MLARIFVLTLLLFITAFASGQTIEPSVLNTGSGSFSEKISVDWSIGESTSIYFFEGPVALSTGIIQPLTEKNGKPAFYILPWAKDEILIFPVPTHRLLDIDIQIPQTGTVTITLSDLWGRIIQQKKTQRTVADETARFDLMGLTPGIYYLNVTLGGDGTPVIRQGAFKIQKL
ncbi:MAG: T9SS type A sorting domain-containing protein [Chitinophagaceae bacterium]|nr:T9SS type A sorting domain-containing protein [Chitinophagaceae bacterium]